MFGTIWRLNVIPCVQLLVIQLLHPEYIPIYRATVWILCLRFVAVHTSRHGFKFFYIIIFCNEFYFIFSKTAWKIISHMVTAWWHDDWYGKYKIRIDIIIRRLFFFFDFFSSNPKNRYLFRPVLWIIYARRITEHIIIIYFLLKLFSTGSRNVAVFWNHCQKNFD